MTPESSLEQLSVIPPRSRAEGLADTLAAHIVDRGLRPGDRVGTLDDVRAEVGFARSTVSEAVRLLRERGLLEIRPGRHGGLFVADPTPLVRLRHTLLKATGSPVSVRDAIELREALEEPVALATARVCGPAEAAELRALVADLGTATNDFAAFMHRNWALHERVAALCPNAMLASVYASCLGYISRNVASYGSDDEVGAYLSDRADVHRRLVEAIVADDAEQIRAAALAHNDTAQSAQSARTRIDQE